MKRFLALLAGFIMMIASSLPTATNAETARFLPVTADSEIDVRLVQSNVEHLKATNECEKCDLRKADLRGINLKGAKLSMAKLALANFDNANLEEADLSFAQMYVPIVSKYGGYGAVGGGASLRKANLNRANLSNAMLNAANLTGASLQDANLRNTDLSETIFFGANFRGAKLNRANMSYTDFRKADMREAIFFDGEPYVAAQGAKFCDTLLPKIIEQAMDTNEVRCEHDY